MRVLVVEDNDDLRAAVRVELTGAGFEVTEVVDLRAAEVELRRGPFACAVFDRMLPDGDSIDFVHGRRVAGWGLPVLFLTARDSVADRLAGFESGGDDYLVKPFAAAELTARVRILASRAGRSSVLRYADLEVDCARRQVHRGGVLLTVSNREFAVLEYLAIRPEQVVTRTELIEHCWADADDPMSNVVDQVIRRLRRKLHEPELLHAVHGQGYRLGTGAAG